MESDPAYRRYKERRERFYRRLTEIRSQTDAVLESLRERMPTAADATRLNALRAEPQTLFQDYLEQTEVFLEHVAKLEAENRRSQMTQEKRPQATRSQAKIEELSLELSTNLRLERVDEAIKELLGFLADIEFYTANVTTSRKRRLRSLQGALEKALA